MLETLKFVQGAVAKKDYVPALTHFRIHNGFIRGYNGSIALCSPIDLNLTCNPRAVQFVKAVQTCESTVQLHMTPTKRLAVRSGSFSALVECLPDDVEYPDIKPEGDTVPLEGDLLETLKILSPFIAEDASRPWARGVLFRGQSAYATNNVIVAERWLGPVFPVEINIPQEAIKELLRIGIPPTSLQVSNASATFHFGAGKWLRCQLYSTQWPDVSPILDRECNATPLPEGFFDSLEKLTPFVGDEGYCYLRGGRVSTTQVDEVGAAVEVPGLVAESCFNLKQLQLVGTVAQRMDLSLHPAPCLFYGDKLRGAIVGMRT